MGFKECILDCTEDRQVQVTYNNQTLDLECASSVFHGLAKCVAQKILDRYKYKSHTKSTYLDQHKVVTEPHDNTGEIVSGRPLNLLNDSRSLCHCKLPLVTFPAYYMDI